MSTPGASQSSSSAGGQEYIVRIPRASNKKFHVMQFTSAAIDISKLTHAKMERENNMKEFKADEDAPKYGAGSEFGRDQREEARRKKHGITLRKYKPDNQPWILKLGGKGGKKYKGIRGGGIRENASYYVFTQAADGAFEASPIEEWYNFSLIQRYKTLSAEEADEEFARRDKVMNHFAIMFKKRGKKEEDLDGDEKTQEKKKKKKGKQSSEFKLTDRDDWSSDSDNESEDDDEEGEKKDKKKEPKKAKKTSKKKKKDSDEEAMEESDEGDFDDREVDYISESSSSSGEEADDKANREMKGVEDEDALRKLDNSEDEDEEEKKEGAENEENAEEKPAPDQKAKPAKEKKGDKGGSSGESSGETSDSDFDDSNFQSAMFMQKSNRKKTGSDNSASNSRANTPTKMLGQQKNNKRKLDSIDGTSSSLKRPKNEASTSASSGMSSSSEGITDDAVRRYLMRKPMTTTELLQKFRSAGKKAGLTGNELVTTIAKILKRLNPEKQTIKGKLYLSIKS